jgi:hypothetical protein
MAVQSQLSFCQLLSTPNSSLVGGIFPIPQLNLPLSAGLPERIDR